MSKRTIRDVESTVSSNKTLKKQRKEKKEKGAARRENGTNGKSKEAALLEKEKKNKKEKKSKKDKDESTIESPMATEAMDIKPAETPEMPKLSKEVRKAAKKVAKEAERQKKAAGSSKAAPAVDDGTAADAATKTSTSAPPINTNAYSQCAQLTALPDETAQAYLKEHSISVIDPRNSNLRPITNFSYLPSHSFNFGNFKDPTPIQAATWPFTLSGHDCIGVAETGSGKTLAFSVPAIRHICALLDATGGNARKLGIRVLAVSPTRELAMQIFEVLEKYSKEAGLSAACVYGGVSKDEQRSKLKRAQFVVATPGRLNDLIDEGSADLSKVSYLVLDEADRMLDKGFEEDIKRIMAAISSPKRQTLMFTATWPQSVRELASKFMNFPVKITIGDRDELRANVRIKQTVEVLDQRAKEQRLLSLVKQHQSGTDKDSRILVFCLYKKEANRIEGFLRARGCRVAGIHGDLGQAQRTQALGQFKSGQCPLLVATDVAARGLDIPAVKLVINVTFPLTIEDYVHRIGRTGRAGADGMAYTFFTENDKTHSGSLINILRAANQPVPEGLLKFGTTVKKKEHSGYGAFYKDTGDAKTSTRITFND